MSDLWMIASGDAENERDTRMATSIRVKASAYWPVLASAESPDDFSNRLALVGDRLDEIVASVTGDDPMLFIQHRGDLHDFFIQNFVASKTASGEQCEVCGKPATKYVGGQSGYSASGHHVCDTHADRYSKTASEGLTNADLQELAAGGNELADAMLKVRQDSGRGDDGSTPRVELWNEQGGVDGDPNDDPPYIDTEGSLRRQADDRPVTEIYDEALYEALDKGMTMEEAELYAERRVERTAAKTAAEYVVKRAAWRIRSDSEYEDDSDEDGTGVRLFWSNASGWVPYDQADTFVDQSVSLPIGGYWYNDATHGRKLADNKFVCNDCNTTMSRNDIGHKNGDLQCPGCGGHNIMGAGEMKDASRHTAATHGAMNTPWGASDDEHPLGEGIVSVGTPSHGGIYCEPAQDAQVRQWLTDNGFNPTEVASGYEPGWWEEDCAAYAVMGAFPERFADPSSPYPGMRSESPASIRQKAIEGLSRWFSHDGSKTAASRHKFVEDPNWGDESSCMTCGKSKGDPVHTDSSSATTASRRTAMYDWKLYGQGWADFKAGLPRASEDASYGMGYSDAGLDDSPEQPPAGYESLPNFGGPPIGGTASRRTAATPPCGNTETHKMHMYRGKSGVQMMCNGTVDESKTNWTPEHGWRDGKESVRRTAYDRDNSTWDTNEVSLWFNNDVQLYQESRGATDTTVLRDLWGTPPGTPNDTVDPNKVDWDEVLADVQDDGTLGMDSDYTASKTATFKTAEYMQVWSALSPENQEILDGLDPIRAAEVVARLLGE